MTRGANRRGPFAGRLAGVPHHVIQRCDRRQQTFFSDEDYEVCRTLLAEGCRNADRRVGLPA